MNTSHMYLMVKGLSDAEGDLLIHLRWPVMITGLECLEAARKLAYFTKLPDERVRACGLMRLAEHSSLQSLTALPDWTMRAMFDLTPDRHHFVMNAHIRASARYHSFNPIPEKPSMLALPSRIDFAEHTATIRRTQEVSFYALSLYLDDGWQKMRRGHFAARTVNRRLLLHSETPMDGHTRTGNRKSKQTKD